MHIHINKLAIYLVNYRFRTILILCQPSEIVLLFYSNMLYNITCRHSHIITVFFVKNLYNMFARCLPARVQMIDNRLDQSGAAKRYHGPIKSAAVRR